MANRDAETPAAVEDEVARATRGLQAGDFGGAEAVLNAILKSEPQHYDALHLSGVSRLLQGKADAAADFFRKAIEANPKAAKSFYNLGLIHNGRRQYEDALECFRSALDLDDADPEVWCALGSSLASLGRHREAVEAYNRAIALDDKNAEAHNDLGTALGNLGQLDDALAHFRQAIDIDPGYARAHNNLGIALGNLGQHDKAVIHLRQAVAINRDYAEAYNNLGTALKELGRLEEAIESYRKSIDINGDNPQAHGNLGTALSALGRQEEAIVQFRKAIDVDPGYAEGHGNLGTVLGELGRQEEAVTHFRNAIEHRPDYAEMHRHLAFIKTHAKHDNDIKAMEELFDRSDVNEDQKLHLAFGLGKSFEDLKQYEKAFEFFVAGNALKRKSIKLGIDKWEALFGELKTTFNETLFETRGDVGCQDETPIFVLGMPRSGTTLVEQILASHPDVYAAGELNCLGDAIAACFGDRKYPADIPVLDEASFSRLGDSYVADIRKKSADARFITDKLPHNFVHIGLIRLILPKAKIIHCQRSPEDTCLSIFKTYFARDAHSYAYDQSELGRYYKLYLDLMTHWHGLLPGIIHDIQYEDLVQDQEAQTRTLLGHCGLEWHEDCLKFYETERAVKTASAAQVRQPIYKGSVQSWKRYEKQLAPLLEALR